MADPIIKQDDTSSSVTIGADNAQSNPQDNTGQSPDTQAAQAGQQGDQGRQAQTAQAQTPDPNKPNTMGSYTQGVVRRNGNYIIDGGKIYNRRDGKLFQVTGGDQGEVEVHPEEAAKIELTANAASNASNQIIQTGASSSSAVQGVYGKVDTSDVITEEMQKDAIKSGLAGILTGGLAAYQNKKALFSANPKEMVGAWAKVGGGLALPSSFTALRNEINKGAPSQEVLVIGDNDPAPPIERMTKSQLAQEAMSVGLGAAGATFPLGLSIPAFSVASKLYEIGRTMVPYTARPYVREGQVRQLENDLNQFYEGIRKGNEVKYD